MTEAAGYAAPLLAVDQVLEVSARGIHTIKAIAGNEAFFQGHYPHFPIFPGVFVLEAVHQAARLFVADGLRLSRHVRLVEIRSVRFLSLLRPGDVLHVDARCTHAADAGELMVDSKCWRGDASPVTVAHIKLRYVLEL
jgi:3-hydroxyacyl-[acyl-carrier-protein] dehydratase